MYLSCPTLNITLTFTHSVFQICYAAQQEPQHHNCANPNAGSTNLLVYVYSI
jgi:hypothetical protein